MRLIWAGLVGLGAASTATRYAAMSMAPDGLMPRYFMDASEPLAKRAVGCGDNQHDCQDIEHPEICCLNDSYCYVNSTLQPACCPIGSNCSGNSKCSSTAYYCTTTTTQSGKSTVETGCCPRSCPGTSLYQCASSLGGNCCSFDEECRPGGLCVGTVTQQTTASTSANGCQTSQFKCSDGPGCCDNFQHCTSVSGTGFCAAGNPTNTNFSVEPIPGGGGLSDGAKAGIAVGVIVGAAIIVGALTWLFLSRRKRRRRTLTQPSGSGSDPRSGTQDETAMTDVSAPTRPPAATGSTQDYFGPDAVAGPFTVTAGHDKNSASPMRAVPSQPHAPGDIAAPVEIDSASRIESPYLSPNMSPHQSPPTGYHETPQSETIEGRYELHGSAVSPTTQPPELPTPHSPRSEDPHPSELR